MLIEPRDHLDPELATLLTARQRELREAGLIGGGADEELDDPVHHLVGVVNGLAVACGGLQPLDAATAEIKRMYVRPRLRGRGLARQLLAALEDLAFLAGHRVVRLETGCSLPAALRLYASSGYAEIPLYGRYVDNPYSVCFEKRLPVAA